jgi:hypothetical protein
VGAGEELDVQDPDRGSAPREQPRQHPEGRPSAPEGAPPVGAPSAPAPFGPGADHHAAHLAKAQRREADTLWRPNPREQGLIGLTDAIHWFGSRGWSVSLPLIDSQAYDLVVDDGGSLHRVQVKTTTRRSSAGGFLVQVCTRGGNRSFSTTKSFDPTSCDLLYVLTDDRDRYLIPSSEVRARHTVTLGQRFAPFLLSRPPDGPGLP